MQGRLTLPIGQKLWNRYDAYQKPILENMGSDRKKGLCLPRLAINSNIELQENRVIDLSIHNQVSVIGVVDLHFELFFDLDPHSIEKIQNSGKRKITLNHGIDAMRIQEC